MGDKQPDETEFTEATDLDVDRVDLVNKAANGTEFILAKGAQGLLSPEQVLEALEKAGAVSEGSTDADGDGDDDEPDDDPEGEEDDEGPAKKAAADELAEFTKAHGDHSFQYLEKAEDGSAFVKRTFTAEQRRTAAKSGAALPDGSYPIENGGDLHNAIHAIGRGSNHSHAEIHDHIVRRAKALGLKAMLPKSWGHGDGSMSKSAEGTLSLDTDEFRKAVEDATAEIRKASEERVTTLEAELTKMRDTPVPGGPMLAPMPGAAKAQPTHQLTERQQQAAKFAKMAEDPTLDPALRSRYAEFARKYSDA